MQLPQFMANSLLTFEHNLLSNLSKSNQRYLKKKLLSMLFHLRNFLNRKSENQSRNKPLILSAIRRNARSDAVILFKQNVLCAESQA